ncbi:MAG: alanine--glyoxylate aminotransferase family protein [Promethearchaeati archaeon SRVP18_Atabeyarchaeia-1]
MDEKLIMLPGPTQVPERILKVMSKPMINHRGASFEKLYAEIADGLKYLFQTEKNDVYPLTASGTGGVECVATNLIEKGDKVIVPTNGEFSERLMESIRTAGAEVVNLKSELGVAISPNTVEETLDKHKDAKMVAFVYNETACGVRNPARELTEIAKDHGAMVICDAISNLGGDYLYMDRWGVDAVITGSQKCLACPPGLSFISLGEDAWKKVEQRKGEKHTLYFDLVKIREFHKKNSTPFTPAVSLIFALQEALKMLREEGIEKRIKRHIDCSKAMRDGLKSLGLKMFPKDEKYASNTVTASWGPQGVPIADMIKALLEDTGIVIAGGMGETKGKIFRVGTMGVCTQKEVKLTLDGIGAVISKLSAKARNT